VPTHDDEPKLPAISLAVDGVVGAYRAVERLPIVGSWVSRGVSELMVRGEALVTAIAVAVVERVLDQIDLTALVRERVDIDAIVADVDIDAIINRIDLIGLSNTVIDGVDLPTIIRESTSSVTAEVMTDVRSQGERADDIVSGIVDRMLGRSRAEQ
jgi:hypothetical protein